MVKKMLLKNYGGTVNSQKNQGEEKPLGALSVSVSGVCQFHKQHYLNARARVGV